MSDTPPPSVLGSLPAARPQRRSAKRTAPADAGLPSKAAAARSAPTKVKAAAKQRAAAKVNAAAKQPTKVNAAPEQRAAAKVNAAAESKTRARTKLPARAKSSPAKPGDAQPPGPKLTAVPPPRSGPEPPRSPPEPPTRPGAPRPVRPTPSIDLTEVAGTAVKAAAELAEIGLSAGARALKLAVSRLPRR